MFRQEFLEKLIETHEDMPAFILEHAVATGFNPEWMEKQKESKKDDGDAADTEANVRRYH